MDMNKLSRSNKTPTAIADKTDCTMFSGTIDEMRVFDTNPFSEEEICWGMAVTMNHN